MMQFTEYTVKVEAEKIARMIVKLQIRQHGEKLSAFKSSEVSTAARQLVQRDPKITKRARYNVEWAEKHANELSLSEPA